MKNNYNKIVAFILLALISVSSQALLYKNEYFVWTHGSVAEDNAGMGELAIPGLKALSRADTPVFWNSGEPNNSSSREHCVTQAKNGGWNDTRCDASRRLACFNGTNWAVSPTDVDMTSYWSTLLPPGCPAGYSFAAPMNLDQKLALDAVIPSGDVWINAYDNDRGVNPPAAVDAKEGVWVFNRGITNLFGPNWASGEPANDGAKNCASINASGQWVAESCSQPRAVFCARQDFGDVQVITANTANTINTNIEAMHEICRTEVTLPGANWMFAAPRSQAENQAVVNALSAAGITGSAWINALGNRTGQTWQTNLDLTNWAAGEPNVSNGQCAVARSSDGKWKMADCDSRAKLLCTDSANWITRAVEHQFSNQAIEACSRPDSPTETNNTYSTYQLVTPITEADRIKAYNALRAGSGDYWLNLRYITDTGGWLRNDQYKRPEFNGSNPQTAVWYHVFKDGNNNELYGSNLTEYHTGASITRDVASNLNKGVSTYFADKEPNGSDTSNQNNRSSCIQLYASGGNAGLWDDTRCDNNSKRVACFDGYEWAISPTSTPLGSNVDTNENVSAGHAACAAIEKNGVTGNFVFAAPRSFNQSQQLLTVARESGASDVWINVNSKKYKRAFVFNLGADVVAPFWNPGEPNNFNGNEDCAVQRNGSGLWNDLSCAVSHPIACYSPKEGNNGTWKLATASTYSDTETLTKLCETQFGAEYKFYAPETLSQMRDLRIEMDATPNAFINANDIEYEGTWVMNQGINNWAAGQLPYANDNKQCVTANASSGDWHTRNCANEFPVACSSGNSWYFTQASVKLDDFANGQAACTAEFGQGYIFQAPRSLSAAEELRFAASKQGIGSNYWINGNRLESDAVWKWNQVSLDTPIWGTGQPAGGSKNSCALLNNNTQGAWEDALCDQAQNYAFMCRNGSQWQASTITGNLADFSTGTAACNALGAGWEFAAPATYNENVQAKNAMGANAKVWVNATDALKEGEWLLNAAPAASYPNWADSLQPGNCAYQSDQGKLHTISCGSSEEQAWSCTDGYTWRVTTAQGKVGSFAEGHKACLNEFGGSFIFAAPLSKNDAVQLDFARLLTAKENSTDINKVWLNMTTGGSAQLQAPAPNNGKFRRNLPFSNWNGLLAGQEPSIGQCAYKGSTLAGVNNPWLTSNCTSFSAHYACTNGSQWKVATSKGRIENGVISIVPTQQDFWSYERGTSMCKEQFGGSYYFSAPVTAADELALDAAIRTTNAQVRRVWLNTYGVSSLSGVDNKWFVNRLHLGVWQKPDFRNYNNSDCAILHPDGSWTDVSCKNNTADYAFACYDGEWSVKGNGKWEEGFAACDDSTASLFAVPRTPDEMTELLSKMGSEPVWINLTDTASESQWIANRLRFTWWAANEPSNVGNRDCARVSTASGEWYAGKCSIEAAPFACRTIDGGTIKWDITTSEGIWSDGFGACQREFEGSEFKAPEGYGTISAKADQDALSAVINSAPKDAWINLSDQDVEGSWRAHRAYADWATTSLLDETNDCGYLDRNSNTSATWLADSCKYTASTSQARGYACTDGYQWKILNETPTTDMRWSAGFAACQALGAQWRFGAPTNSFENTKLKLAMELHGTEQTQVWLNAHDRFVEGEWVLNGPETNFAPIIDVSAVATKVDENSTDIQLVAQLLDDEEEGIASATWTLVSNIGSRSGTSFNDIQVTNNVLTAGANGSGTVTAQYSTPVLFNEDRLLTFKVTATDIAPSTATPATAETFVQVRVYGPLVAAWNFENTSQAHIDITGHGHNAITSDMPQVVTQDGNSALKLDGTKRMTVPGKNSSPSNGIEYPADSYTIAFRMSIEESNSSIAGWPDILKKGDASGNRQPLLYLNKNLDELVASQSDIRTNTSYNHTDLTSPTEVNNQQWLNIVYVQDGNTMKLYVDNVLVSQGPTLATPLQNNGDLTIGGINGPTSSLIGLIDDVHVYNRVLSAGELAQVLPTLPIGTVQFAGVSDQVNEDAGSHSITLERTRGSDEALTVYVDFDSAGSSATMGLPSDMTPASNPADLAFTDESLRVSGKGIPVTWAAGEKGSKSFSLILDAADDGIREGTEIARFVINDLNGAKAGENQQFNLRLLDVTPNPYGNFSVSIDGLGSKRIPENGAAQEICFVRESGSTGEVTVNYQISGNAVVDVDFTHIGAVVPAGNTGSLTFVDGQSANQCISIQPINSPAIGEPDKTYSVEITSISPANPTHDPLLTEQRVANLVIYDWAPGEFAFTAATYSCKEPNDSVKVPVSKRATEAEMTCTVAVTRTNTGAEAPAASLSVTTSNSYDNSVSGISYTFNDTLLWPAIDSENPANPQTETQLINFVIDNNNIHDDDLNVSITLVPSTDEVITQGAAVLSIEDVTEPAVVTITRDKADINEGEPVTFTVTRTENSATEFDFNYTSTLVPAMINNFDHYFDISGSNGKESGVLSFTKGGVNTHTLTFNSIDTIENNPDFTLSLLLGVDAINNHIVGFGDLSAAGTAGTGSNTTDASTLVKNRRDLIADNYSILMRDMGIGRKATDVTLTNASTGTGRSYITQNIETVPTERSVEITLTIPAGLHIDDGATYAWRLQNQNGDNATWHDGYEVLSNSNGLFDSTRTGTIGYDSTGVNRTQSSVVKTNLTLPFVAANKVFRLVLDISGNTETYSKSFEFTVTPLYRQLHLKSGGNNDYCLAHFGRGGCIDNGVYYPDTRWAWNPTHKILINMGQSVPANNDYKCFYISGSTSTVRDCGNLVNLNEITFKGSDFELGIGSDKVCSEVYGWFQYRFARVGGFCSNADKNWEWREQ